ncbi:type II secretion system protein N [Pseudoduganella rivuli]|uniref:type II secretion system protein N n=1 Tax=Pseudoduganella rivuli TaxID=2666085 RepID=UPI001E56AB4E|nr:type II secretion system protein N [Pseudoduganella rivuli]
MKRLPVPVTAATFGAIAALSASMAYWGMQLFKEQQRPIAAVVHQAPLVPSIEAAKGLFGGDVAVAVASNYQLKGVVAAINGRHSVAIIAADGQPPKAYPVGAEVAPGVKVQEVAPRHVMLSEGGIPKRIDLPADAPSSGGGAAAMLPPLPSQAPAPATPPAMQPAPPMPVPQNMPPPQTPMTGGGAMPPPRQ